MTVTFKGWQASSASCFVLLVLPILAIFYIALGSSDDIFPHLLSTVMPTYTYNTVVVLISVLLLSLLFGIPSAWLMAMCRLPSEKYLQWALVLPLAMPGYIIGYVFTDWFDFAGPIQVLLRSVMGWQAGEYWFPDLRTLQGASFVLALVLYPYVYLLCRAAFMEQSVTLLQSARLLGCTPWQSFYRVSLPLVRPAIAVGLSLVAMETIGDFGTVSYFSVSTLTTAVYDTWLGYSNLTAAAKISACILLVVVLLLSAERYSRRKQQLFQSQFSSHDDCRYVLQGWKKWCALIWCWGLVGIAFLLPVMQLCWYAYQYFAASIDAQFQSYVMNSLKVSIIAAMIGVVVALVVNFYQRLNTSNKLNPNAYRGLIFMRGSSLGYAVPGTVLAIGVMVIVTTLDRNVNELALWLEYRPPGLLFSGSMFALILALVVRFSAVAIGSVESSLNKVSPSLDMAAKTMGCHTNKMLRRVHLPLIKRGVLIAFLLVFIESMKELNAAILLRPFNFETLATYVFNYASDEQLEMAAMPAVLLVLVGLLPLIIINRSLEESPQ